MAILSGLGCTMLRAEVERGEVRRRSRSARTAELIRPSPPRWASGRAPQLRLMRRPLRPDDAAPLPGVNPRSNAQGPKGNGAGPRRRDRAQPRLFVLLAVRAPRRCRLGLALSGPCAVWALRCLGLAPLGL